MTQIFNFLCLKNKSLLYKRKKNKYNFNSFIINNLNEHEEFFNKKINFFIDNELKERDR